MKVLASILMIFTHAASTNGSATSVTLQSAVPLIPLDVNPLDKTQTIQLIEEVNKDGKIDKEERQLLIRLAREKRRLEHIERKKAIREARLLSGAIRKKRMSSKCEEHLPLVENGRWNCNSRTESCQLECEQNLIRTGRIRKQCKCDDNDENCSLVPSYPSTCESVTKITKGKNMSEKAVEEMWEQTARGFPACTSFTLENGSTRCSQANMRKSVCTHTCNDGYILVGETQQKCLCDREGCQWGANGLNFLQMSDEPDNPVCKPAQSVNFCSGLAPAEVPTGVTATCLDEKYDVGSRCQLECSDSGQAFNGKIFDKIRYGSCSCPTPDTCRWTFDLETCEDVNECERNSNACGENAMCVDRKQGFDCICKCGYVKIDGECVLKSHKDENGECSRGWSGMSCNDPDRSNTFPCYYRGASIFRTASEMDCSNLQSDGILERATIPGDTQILKLAGNAISDDVTLKVIMESLESVYEAQIHGNELVNLGEGMFSQNCNLEVLSLGHGNKGVQLDPNVFLGANKIKILDLGSAETVINAEIFSPLTGLQYLFLQHNNIDKISSSLFKNNDLIEYIDASDSNIEEIAGDAFQNNSKLSQLLLRQNGIRTLEPGTFDGVSSLSFIDLGRNMLKSVDSSMFKSNFNVRIVDLDSNKLVKICSNAFDAQKNSLIAINLSDNGALPEQLTKHFCNDSYCDATINDFYESLASYGDEC